MDESQQGRVVQALSADASELRAEAAELIIDFVLDQPLARVLELEELRAPIMKALTAENLSYVIEQHVKPGWQRYAEAARSADVALGDLLPEASRLRIAELIARTRPPPARWAKHAVDPALVRKLFAPVFAQVLAKFARRLPIPGVNNGSEGGASQSEDEPVGLAQRLSRGVQKRTGRLVDVGRSAMGGLGAELEKRLQTAAKDFAGGAMELFRESLRERLKSDEGKALLRQIREQAFACVMATQIREFQRDADRLPIAAILELVPAIVAHAAPHELVTRVVDDEVAAFLRTEGARPLREVLAQLGVLEDVRGAARPRVDALLRQFFTSAPVGAWLQRLLAL